MKYKKKLKIKKKFIDLSLSIEEIKKIKGGNNPNSHDLVTPTAADGYDDDPPPK